MEKAASHCHWIYQIGSDGSRSGAVNSVDRQSVENSLCVASKRMVEAMHQKYGDVQ